MRRFEPRGSEIAREGAHAAEDADALPVRQGAQPDRVLRYEHHTDQHGARDVGEERPRREELAEVERAREREERAEEERPGERDRARVALHFRRQGAVQQPRETRDHRLACGDERAPEDEQEIGEVADQLRPAEPQPHGGERHEEAHGERPARAANGPGDQGRERDERQEGPDRSGNPVDDREVRQQREGGRGDHCERNDEALAPLRRHFALRSATWAASASSEPKIFALSWSSSFSLKP